MRLVDGQDEIGQPITTWEPFASGLWANIKHLSGVETIKAGAQAAVGTASIRLRSYRTDLTTAMRVKHGATEYEITAVLPDETGRKYTDLTCKAVS